MTSTTDTAGHPDVAEISDLTEGLLPPSRTADIRQHVDGCDLCADTLASLEEIRGLLGTLPGPARMPDDVAGRIDAALAAEALLDATAPDGEETAQRVDPSPSLSAAEADAPVSRETSLTTDRPTGRARVSTTGPGRKGRRGKRRRAAVLGAVFTAAALGLGSLLLSSLNDGNSSTPEARGRQSASDTFSQGTLEDQVAGLLARSSVPASGSHTPHSLGVEGNAVTDSPRTLKQPAVPGCVQKGIGREDSALATEDGTYQGKHAVLVVLPDPSDTTLVTAYIVDATCVDHPASATATVLLKQSYTRS
ncbi:hypothetical protein ABZT03_00960 [Streptomyces sp. NPDC005574]|uniref:hypothetical protein n=1 Tax=Streptomyces sp. NPDC005574 TaxID=3156891 RepID=UPI0033B03EF1